MSITAKTVRQITAEEIISQVDDMLIYHYGNIREIKYLINLWKIKEQRDFALAYLDLTLIRSE